MGKIAIYTRVSSEKQASEDRYSLAVQKERCEALLISQGYKREDFAYYCVKVNQKVYHLTTN
jgi:DNA invertase Pin-like site-specific DNA recombinase